MIDTGFWKNKRVFVTGHTGFKGSWLALWLSHLGAEVVGYSLDPIRKKGNFVMSGIGDLVTDLRGDIRDREHLSSIYREYQPDIVFHLAAQPLVRASYRNPIETYEANLMGTLNVLECIRASSGPQIAVFITTDKCYENREQIWGYRENDPLGGHDPYSSSKGAAEIAIRSWRSSFFSSELQQDIHKSISSARAGNVIGGGDWAEDRLIPDCISSLRKGKPIEIRNPRATRPWQHVLEPLGGYMLLAQKMAESPGRYDGGWNFGPNPNTNYTVGEVVSMLINGYGRGNVNYPEQVNEPHEAHLLGLDITKAIMELGWRPRLDIGQAIDWTVEWYRDATPANSRAICLRQIDAYTGL